MKQHIAPKFIIVFLLVALALIAQENSAIASTTHKGGDSYQHKLPISYNKTDAGRLESNSSNYPLPWIFAGTDISKQYDNRRAQEASSNLSIPYNSANPNFQSDQNGTVESVGQIGGLIYATQLRGQYAYVCSGPSLVVLDMSNPVLPVMVGKSAPSSTLLTNVTLAGNFAYVTDYEGNIHIFDISGPTPIEIGSFHTSNDTFDVAVSGTYAFIANGEAGLRIINIANPSTPVEVSNYDTSGVSRGVEVIGSIAYVADGASGLKILNISNPVLPVEIGHYLDPLGEIYTVQVVGNYAYVVDGFALRIINITNPTAPFEMGAYFSTAGSSSDVAILGEYAYLAEYTPTPGDGGLRIIDISDPGNMVGLAFINTKANAQRVSVENNLVLVADTFGVSIFDVTNPSTPVEVKYYGPPTQSYSIAISGNYAFIGDQIGIRIVNISDPFNPTPVGAYLIPDGNIVPILSAGNYLYLGDVFYGLRILDVSTPEEPIQVGSINVPGDIYDMASSGSFVYLATKDHGLRIIDVSNPDTPIETSSLEIPGSFFRSVAVNGNFAFIADEDYNAGGLRVINISDKAHPVEIGHYQEVFQAGKSVKISNSILYVQSSKGSHIVDISNPFALNEIGFLSVCCGSYSIDILGDYEYVGEIGFAGNGNGGLRVLDIFPPSDISDVGFASIPLWGGQGVAASGNFIYVTGDWLGFYVFRFHPSQSASTAIQTTGGVLSSKTDNTSYNFPAGAFSDTVTITHTIVSADTYPFPNNLKSINHIFDLTAVYQNNGMLAQLVPGATYTITIQYHDSELGGAIENTLALYWWNGSMWERELTSTIDTTANIIRATPNHFSQWAVLGETNRVFLPAIMKLP